MLGYILDFVDAVRHEIRYRREGPRRYSPPPVPPTAPHPSPRLSGSHTSSTTAELSSSLQPIKSWSHPFGDRSNPLLQLTQLAKAGAGYYPLGCSGLWHGGVHFDAGTEGILDHSQARCLADGEVVAYRIPEHAPINTFFPEPGVTIEAPFASGFVLVRHRLEAPKIEDSDNTPPSLTFYSLYMHLQDWSSYQSTPTLARPNCWPEQNLRVKADVSDSRRGTSAPRGLSVLNKAADNGHDLDLLSPGTPVVVSGEGKYRKLENTRGPASLRNEDGTLQGYVASRYLDPLAGATHRVNCDRLNVRPGPNANSKELFELRYDTEVTVSGEGEFRKLESIAQYVQFTSLQGERIPQIFNHVVVLDQPVPIKAGELIGHIGPYQESNETAPQKKLHLEVFTGDDMEAFIEASRLWALRLPDRDKTWLKLAKGTPVVTHQDGFSATLLPILSGPNTPSGADLLVPKSLLDGLPADRRIQLPATESRKACNWYRLDGLLSDADGNLLDGWIREDVGVTPWVSPWTWEGYDILSNMDTGRSSLAYLLKIIGHFGERELEQFGPLADRSEQSLMRARLYDIIDPNRDGNMTAEELQAALRLPAHAQAIAQLVMYHETEWRYTAQKWDALDEILGHSNSTPILNWLAEKRRIKQLSWWDEVAMKVGLPAHGKVYHFHPVGLVGNFLVTDECACGGCLGKEFSRYRWVRKRSNYSDVTYYGPGYHGTKKLDKFTGWNDLISKGKATEDEKAIVIAMSSNEGAMNAVQAWDWQTFSAGAMQKTVTPEGYGELPKQISEFQAENPVLFGELFAQCGWSIRQEAKGARIYYLSNETGYREITGDELYNFIKKGFQQSDSGFPPR